MYPYSIEELKAMHPSSKPLALLGEIPTCKSIFVDGEQYSTLWGTGHMADGKVLAGQITLKKYEFTALGDKLRVIFDYSGTTKYKEYCTDPSMSLRNILKNRVEMDTDDFKSIIKPCKYDTYFIRKFKERVIEILKQTK